MARLKDIAEAAGVSIRTVTRALAGEGYVEAGARKRILDAARRLDYRPDQRARSLRMGRSREILVVAITNAWGGQRDELQIAKIAGMERVLRAAEFSLDLLFGVEEQAKRAGRHLVDELAARRPAGVALSAYASPVKQLAQRLTAARLPYVLLDPPADEPVDGVRHDRARGVREAVLWLAERGRRTIAYLGPTGERSRLDGYEAAMRELGREPIVVDLPGAEWAEYVAAAPRLLAHSPRPDAVQVYGDTGALGLLHGLHRLGVRVPEDLAVVGFDDRAAAALASPPLTTVGQRNEELGAAAAEILLAKIAGEPAPDGGWSRVIPTRLVVRESA